MTYNPLTDLFNPNNINPTIGSTTTPQQEHIEETIKRQAEEQRRAAIQEPSNLPKGVLFNLDAFQNTIKTRGAAKNKQYQKYSENISGYDIAKQCIRNTLYRIRTTPIPDYSDSWLPVSFRAILGNACHDFIQSFDTQLTEQEVTLKVPSLRVSSRLDGLINNDVIVEIKSCPYNDYAKIVRTQQPRIADFYQVMLYKYLLDNFQDEIMQQKPSRGGKLPALPNYDLRYLQFVYVCHELATADTESIGESIKFSKDLKRMLGSKKNPFFFLTTVTIDTHQMDITPVYDYIKSKISELNKFLDNGQTPPMDHPHIDEGSCFFCLYKVPCRAMR
jgi:hypothetical protein